MGAQESSVKRILLNVTELEKSNYNNGGKQLFVLTDWKFYYFRVTQSTVINWNNSYLIQNDSSHWRRSRAT